MASRTYSDRSHSSFVASFAKRENISLRTAQRCRRESDPRWQRFTESLRAQTPRPPQPPEADEFEMIAAEDATPENLHACILGMWNSTNKAYWRAVAEGDALGQVDLDAALRTIAKGWRNACKSHERHQRFIREHVPASEVAALLKGFFEPLKTALATMPDEAAAMVNPSNPAAGRQGCLEWLDSRMAPVIDRALERLADYAVAI